MSLHDAVEPAQAVSPIRPPEPEELFTSGPNGRPIFNPTRALQALRREAPTAVGGEALHRYHHGVYRPDGERWLRRRLAELVRDRWRKSQADEVVTLARDTSPTLRTPPLDVLNCRNGLLDLNSAQLSSHDPALLSAVQIGAAYQPNATCARFEKFLEEALEPDAAVVVTELVAYLVTPDNSLQRAAMLLGSGANGKSVYLATLTALLGEDNVCAVPLAKLDEDRFAASNLVNKLANIHPDLDASALRHSSVFKAITGGDRLQAERKFRPSFTFKPFARLIFSANSAPPTADSSEAYFRRWVVVPFERRFTGQARDPNLVDKLTTPDSLSGILNLVLPTLAPLRKRGDFTASETTKKAGDEFRIQVDSVSGFLDELCAVEPEHQVTKPALARAYRDWCTANGRGALSTQRLNERVLALLPVTEITVRGVRMWRGLILREDES